MLSNVNYFAPEDINYSENFSAMFCFCADTNKRHLTFYGIRTCEIANFYDIDKLIDLLVAVSRLFFEKTNIKELDLNPVRLFEKGLMVLDVRVRERGTVKGR